MINKKTRRFLLISLSPVQNIYSISFLCMCVDVHAWGLNHQTIRQHAINILKTHRISMGIAGYLHLYWLGNALGMKGCPVVWTLQRKTDAAGESVSLQQLVQRQGVGDSRRCNLLVLDPNTVSWPHAAKDEEGKGQRPAAVNPLLLGLSHFALFHQCVLDSQGFHRCRYLVPSTLLPALSNHPKMWCGWIGWPMASLDVSWEQLLHSAVSELWQDLKPELFTCHECPKNASTCLSALRRCHAIGRLEASS